MKKEMRKLDKQNNWSSILRSYSKKSQQVFFGNFEPFKWLFFIGNTTHDILQTLEIETWDCPKIVFSIDIEKQHPVRRTHLFSMYIS
jgi:hypothetical protein